ncbi:hypothetical protein [Pseudomonas sp. 5P_3.1_Bac2]|uniref:hypothetical protein n=1 Tax=Pseudomonas sp. 5P_3.1_Bac2 TaxID=2971617 RepID=UPI0021C9EA85|nr:hypothetical protein [Pseudomonas sp. 5P_3.1_Bac2]MCU1717296.1 hypothetical protein [Pseudomonas sp. 5P_3.1_Bac2]
MEKRTAPTYEFDGAWQADSDWKVDSLSNFETRARNTTQDTLTHLKSNNGGASFAAWNQASATAEKTAPQTDLLKSPAPQSPGFYVIQQSMSGDQVIAKLFTDPPTPNILTRIKSLNPTFSQGYKAGEILVLGNLINPTACLREEADLMAAAAQVRTALAPLSETEANFMVQHQAEISLMIDGASQSLGITKDVLDKGLQQIQSTLRDIEYLHQREFTAHGHLQSQQFFATRQQLLRQLDSQLKATFLGKQLGLGSYHTLRQDLGISTKSLVHHWSRSGAPGQIPGYATHMTEVSKAAKFLKAGGYIGLALGGTASSLKVQEVCQAGDAQACQKIRFTETGSFAGGIALGTAAVPLASRFLAGPICVAIGVGSAGVGGVACALLVIGAASYGAGRLGGDGGEVAGELLYEGTR